MPRPPVQRFPVRSRPSVTVVFVASLTWAACGPTLPPLAAPAPAEIPHLETMASEQPAHVTALVRLGAAYRSAGRLEEARETLQRAALLNPRDGGVALYLGLTHEDLGELGEARRLYEHYIRNGSSAAGAQCAPPPHARPRTPRVAGRHPPRPRQRGRPRDYAGPRHRRRIPVRHGHHGRVTSAARPRLRRTARHRPRHHRAPPRPRTRSCAAAPG
jgi:hypothetical protein